MEFYVILMIKKGVAKKLENQKNNGGLIALVIVFCLLVLGLGGYIVYDKVLSNKETPIDNSDSNNTDNNSSNTISFPTESSYTEVPLNAEQRKEINDELLVFNVEHSYALFPFHYDNEKVGADLYSDDCTKVSMAYNYVYSQLIGHIKDAKYPATDYYQKVGDSYTFNVEKIKTLAGTFFNKTVTCNSEPYDKDITVPTISGGGWAGQYLKTVSKYQNGNNYYLIIHLLNTPLNCLQNNNCYEVDDDPTVEGYYFKLKYYKDGTKEYLISLEYLK